LPIARLGVIDSSSPAFVQVKLAERPFTLTHFTESPAKSRLKRDSACVERATIVTVPLTVWSGAAVA
jgi:hypothetical protein